MAPSWRAVHRHARVGVLALSGVENPPSHDALDARRQAIEQDLRTRFAGATRATLRTLDTIRAYEAFYKPFGKSYHVRLQLESIALAGRPLASGTALVQAMFMAEVATQLLTAGHDLDHVEPPLTIAAAEGGEAYVRITGQTQALKTGDMYMADARGILSSVIYGPDERTRLGPGTRRALFVTYAPEGIENAALARHLAMIEDHVRLVAPGARREALAIAGG